ncbi:MAG: phosphocholine cytidylyltransferase family protein [Pseudomonadota bacterium]
MKAVLLSAGQGSRLLPLTNDLPKCLLPVGNHTVLERQLETLDAASAFDEIVVVTGFHAQKVEESIERMTSLSTPVRTLFNPFYKVADNLASCWMAREFMMEDFLIVNGDSLFEPSVLSCVLQGAKAPINLTINFKSNFDSDDMKVTLDGDKVLSVGKTIPLPSTHAESIGLVLFTKEGGASFRNTLDASMRDNTGVNAWYLQIIDRLAKDGLVGAIDIGEREWGEIDYPSDLEEVRRLVSGWDRPRVVA